MNLLSNAFKFTPDGGSISLSLWTEGDTYGFTVRDSGIGMSPEQLTHIFERFYQVDGQRKGTGIGLSLVKMLVEKHHGTITVASEPAQYTEFKVTLPADMAAFTEKERELPAHEVETSTSLRELPVADVFIFFQLYSRGLRIKIRVTTVSHKPNSPLCPPRPLW